MDNGISLQMASLDDNTFTSLTRDMSTSGLNVMSNWHGFQNRLCTLVAECELLQYRAEK